PSTRYGASRLLAASAELAARTGTERLIVKTVAEASRLPTFTENVHALELAAEAAAFAQPTTVDRELDTGLADQAGTLIEAVLELHPDVGSALLSAFEHGVLDVPFCLHPDNQGRATSTVGPDGRLRFTSVGAMPIRCDTDGPVAMTTDRLVAALNHVAREYDR
ncbi:MAG TPA: methylaspartate mutase, partial [Pseudonocardiaceae bacterium]|nr:methylaspartate mutase [Pseudonocardiaceae bacterium]